MPSIPPGHWEASLRAAQRHAQGAVLRCSGLLVAAHPGVAGSLAASPAQTGAGTPTWRQCLCYLPHRVAHHIATLYGPHKSLKTASWQQDSKDHAFLVQYTKFCFTFARALLVQ